MYYGWKIVAALFVVMCFTSGLGFYIHAVLLQALVYEKGFAITDISGAVSIFFCSGGIAGLGISILIDRYDVRYVMVGGALLASVTLSAIGFVSDIWQVYALYLFFGIGFSASGLLPATTLIARWFIDKRALAMSVSTTGLSVGGILVTPISAVLIEQSGVESATPLFGLAYFIGVVPLVLLVIRPFPSVPGRTSGTRPIPSRRRRPRCATRTGALPGGRFHAAPPRRSPARRIECAGHGRHDTRPDD